MTTPNVRCTCTGTCHPPRPGSWDRRERAAHRAYHVLFDMGADLTWRLHWDTGVVHGPLTRLSDHVMPANRYAPRA
jgi:hypothetical protein